MRKGQPGQEIARPGRRVLRNMEQVTRKMCKFKAPAWPAKLNPAQGAALGTLGGNWGI